MSALPPVVAVVGPTATGKTALAVALAQRLGGEVVNADSMQLYRGMDIGTAKPDAAERGGVPHHLLDLWHVREPASVAEYRAHARAEIDRLRAAGVLPLLVGGSGLYIRAVLDELEFPGTDAGVRARLEEELAAVGAAGDARAAGGARPGRGRTILPSNGRRIVRALEVIELTGGPFLASLPEPRPHYPAVVVGVDRDPAELDERIAVRVDRMWAAGFVDEVGPWPPTGCARGRRRPGRWATRRCSRSSTASCTAGGGARAHGRAPPAGSCAASGPGSAGTRHHLVRRGPPRPGDAVTARDHRPYDRARDRPPRVLLGHGTENDFVVLPDPDGTVWPEDRLDAALVRRLCDRRAGLGGDGVLRVVRSAHVPDAPAVLGEALDRCEWFMDHRNADGSHAEMCGNGIRLFLHVLVTEGLLDRSACEAGVLVGTRGGPRRVGATPDGAYWVDMGRRDRSARGRPACPARCSRGWPSRWATRTWPASPTSTVESLDLTGAPMVDPGLFPDGVNVEFVNVLEAGAHVRLRVVRAGGGGDPLVRYRRLRRRLRGRRRRGADRGDGAGRRPRWPAVGTGQLVDDGADRTGRARLRRHAVPGVAGRLTRASRVGGTSAGPARDASGPAAVVVGRAEVARREPGDGGSNSCRRRRTGSSCHAGDDDNRTARGFLGSHAGMTTTPSPRCHVER